MDENSYGESTEEIEESVIIKKARLLRPQSVQAKNQLCAKEERNSNLRKVSSILQKSEHDRSNEDITILQNCSNIVKEAQERLDKRAALKKRLEEFEDPENVLTQKCQILAQAIAQSQHLVVYTGAGISTAAKIPDYRGPNGIWTRLKEGKEIGDHDLSLAEPTYTHMALYELYRQKILKYVVSQNCDGLHLRSGLPRIALSELHGNMYIEVCKTCKPHREYWRSFDVTENTARYSHKTYRRCYVCNGALMDTIVHFGERGSLQWPLNWKGACKNAKEATTIICLGSSLKVLKKYPWLWQMDKPAKKRPNLYIVNLQWTPKDDSANVKINGKCDVVFKRIMNMLGIVVPKYDKSKDPIFHHFTELNELELHTTTQSCLKIHNDDDNDNDDRSAIDEKIDNYIVQKNDSDDHFRHDHHDDYYNDKENEDCLFSNSNSSNDLNLNCDTTLDNKPFNNCLPSNMEVTKSSATAAAAATFVSAGNVPSHANDLIKNILTGIQVAGSYTQWLQPPLSLFGYDFIYNQMFFLYPYQTSLLYPGLHSIINPLPIIKEETFAKKETDHIHNNYLSSSSLSAASLEASPTCDFCYKNYKLITCCFYNKMEPIFKNQRIRFSKIEKRDKPNICICCDYTTEEEEDEDIEENSNDKDPSICNESKDKDTSIENKEQKAKIQAGWFGKGYRKSKRFKRKTIDYK